MGHNRKKTFLFVNLINYRFTYLVGYILSTTELPMRFHFAFYFKLLLKKIGKFVGNIYFGNFQNKNVDN